MDSATDAAAVGRDTNVRYVCLRVGACTGVGASRWTSGGSVVAMFDNEEVGSDSLAVRVMRIS